MSGDDAWAEAHSRLSSALEQAFEAGFTDEEIEDAIENVRPLPDAKPYTPGKPKPKKKGD